MAQRNRRFVNYDLTRQHLNTARDEIQLGGKVPIWSKGWVVTNFIIGTPAAGDIAVLDNSGNVSPVTVATSTSFNFFNKPRVGKFESAKDEDGYAKVAFDL